MKKHRSLSLVFAATLAALIGAFGTGGAHAGELSEPQNAHLTQSSIAPGSRAFIVVDNETALMSNERYVKHAIEAEKWFASNDRRAIAQWLARAERKRPAKALLPSAGSSPAVQHAVIGTIRVPLRTTYSVGPYYANQ